MPAVRGCRPYPERMSLRSPVGPQPSSVYWRRRIVVLLGLIAVIAAVVLIVVRPGASAAPAAPLPSPSAPAKAAAPAASPTPEASPDGTETVTACGRGQVKVVAVTDKPTYEEGESPLLSWTISNTGSAPCSLNVGTKAQVFTITSGSDTVWTSTDCQADGQDVPFTLPTAASGAKPTAVSPLQWDRERSTPDTCGGDRPEVTGGGASYHLTVSVGGFESKDTAQFILN